MRIALPFTPRFITLTIACLVAAACAASFSVDLPQPVWRAIAGLIGGGLAAVGWRDLFNPTHAVLRSYPIAGHLRFLMERVRPEMRQYFFEDDKHGTPFSRDKRALVYQRSKTAPDKRPFGTQYDVYEDGFEWLNHSMAACAPSTEAFRVRIGGPDCTKPYHASIFNISAMSFGALSGPAIRALNAGARLGDFAQDTGEGGVSEHHLQGGDLIWELGSGYFGARDDNGRFSPGRFADCAANPQIRMIEVKLSQGAKPGHGGVLPGAKVTPEIAAARGVVAGADCLSPCRHSAFDGPSGLLHFLADLRRLSGGKPVGFKLCVGHGHEFLAICKAMVATGITPDFIVVDGAEGGTGAAPLEFMDHVGMPLREGLTFVHGALIGIGMRDRISLGASGKIASAFDIARALALGADWCNAGRAFMFSLGCIQALSCHTDHCPTGVATQDPTRQRALIVPDKTMRVRNYHAATMQALAELVAAAGLASPDRLQASHFSRRVSQHEVRSFAELYPTLRAGELLRAPQNARYAAFWNMASPDTFEQQADLATASIHQSSPDSLRARPRHSGFGPVSTEIMPRSAAVP